MILLSLILILLAGVFRAVHTVRKDKAEENIFTVLTYEWGPGFHKWYWGGNQFYSPSWPWSADFWHFFVFMQIYAWTGAAISAAYWPCEWWVYVIAMFGEGWVFTWFYHYVFPLEPAGDFRHFLKRMLTFKNYHKKK